MRWKTTYDLTPAREVDLTSQVLNRVDDHAGPDRDHENVARHAQLIRIVGFIIASKKNTNSLVLNGSAYTPVDNASVHPFTHVAAQQREECVTTGDSTA